MFRMALFIADHGVPYEKAMDMDWPDLVAHNVAIGESQGGVFDWETMTWRKEE